MNAIRSRAVELITSFVGSSLHQRGHELRVFIARGVDDPDTDLNARVSDCGLFAIGVWHALGVPHELLSSPYKIGMAIAWIDLIGRARDAKRAPHDGLPEPGDLLHYQRPGHNDDHVEFVTGEVADNAGQWIADHAGGGRPDCAIGSSHGDLLWSLGRPLDCYYSLDSLVTP